MNRKEEIEKAAKEEYEAAKEWVEEYLREKETIDGLKSQLALVVEALESISKNSCCKPCQQAKLVACKALSQIRGERVK